MAFLIPHSVACALENNKLDFERGKEYECIKGYYMKPNGFEFTKGKTYKCTENYYLPCNNGSQISQFSLIDTERMFRVKN